MLHAVFTIQKIWTAVASMLMCMFAHLLIVLHCHDVVNFLGREVAQIENNGLSQVTKCKSEQTICGSNLLYKMCI